MNLAVRLKSAVSLLGRFPALAGVDLDVAAGEVVLVQGANGAGKTTLLRACAGLVPIVAGEAAVLGFDLRDDRRSVRRHVSLLGHSACLYDDLTVEENLRFIARSTGDPTGTSLQEAPPAMATLGLGGRLAHLAAGRLSAGQRRRVAIAGLLVRRSRLWLLDEPHAGLDTAGRELLDDLVSRAADTGTTVLLASHELDRARPLAQRVVTLAGGQVLAPAREAAGVA